MESINESRVLPAYDDDPKHAAVRDELRVEFALCRLDHMRVQEHDILRAHRVGMPMSEIARLSGIVLDDVHDAIVSSWGRMR